MKYRVYMNGYSSHKDFEKKHDLSKWMEKQIADNVKVTFEVLNNARAGKKG